MRYKNGYVDNGSSVNKSNSKSCPNCGSKNFKETISREKCNNCGYEVDYWGKGANTIAEDTINRMYQKEEERRKEEYRKEQEEEQAAYERINSDWEK